MFNFSTYNKRLPPAEATTANVNWYVMPNKLMSYGTEVKAGLSTGGKVESCTEVENHLASLVCWCQQTLETRAFTTREIGLLAKLASFISNDVQAEDSTETKAESSTVGTAESSTEAKALRLRPRAALRLRPRAALRLRPRAALRLRPRAAPAEKASLMATSIHA